MSSKRKNTPTKWSAEDLRTTENTFRHGTHHQNESESESDGSLYLDENEELPVPKFSQRQCKSRCMTPEDIVSSTVARSNDTLCRLSENSGQVDGELCAAGQWLDAKGLMISSESCSGRDDDIMDSLRAMISSAETLDDKQRKLNTMILQLQTLKDSLIQQNTIGVCRLYCSIG